MSGFMNLDKADRVTRKCSLCTAVCTTTTYKYLVLVFEFVTDVTEVVHQWMAIVEESVVGLNC